MMPRDGWFITDEHLVYQLVNGAPYLVADVDAIIAALAPGYYDIGLTKVGSVEGET